MQNLTRINLFSERESFLKINSGDCASLGMKIINTKSQCKNAAKSLQLQDIFPSQDQSSGRPHGCIYQPDTDYLLWNEPDGNPNPNVPCGYVIPYAPISFDCICEGIFYSIYNGLGQ